MKTQAFENVSMGINSKNVKLISESSFQSITLLISRSVYMRKTKRPIFIQVIIIAPRIREAQGWDGIKCGPSKSAVKCCHFGS